ncbi:MAG TPA: hypothetical protein VFF33_13320 [Ignavibacteriaceae bacterium]|nr:hypothetical protein [Ignavibacteriaceae bacterium]
MKEDITNSRIAILNFSTLGLKSIYGKIIADRLSESFYINNNFAVVDRALINNSSKQQNLTSTEYLSSDQIKQIGFSLKADYIIIGKIEKIQQNNILNQKDERVELNLSFRFISVKSNDIIGMVSYLCSDKDINSALSLAVRDISVHLRNE